MANPMMRLKLLATTAICAPMMVLPAFAQETEDVHELEDIRIEADQAQKVLGNLNVSEEDIDRRNPTSISDVLTASLR